ncbi:hypothetical protein HDF26_004218 [Pedobacter cryoconitis]|uniref:Carboxypeptidase-like protein n=1 Tax=Pedobacter cryoconitis TaxID=188932 RepID=A0A7W8ZJW1_9SPHI|nr:hypothetical protein [Pedobacter cryoconitis]MBB5635381.1 hypothetical protein [Pedobacter cryoconitis]MBB6273758.1 hypothetical protein [Pedobacter cryoconitis]
MIRTILRTLFVFTFLFASVTVVFAQQDFQLNGVVMAKGTTNRIAMAQISNLRTKFTVSSNDLGLFQVKANLGDTLVIYKQDYSDKEIIVLSNKDLIVYLDNGAGTTLQEVNIRGKSKKTELDELKQDYRDKGSFYGGKPPLLSYIFAPITALYELFGRTPKNAKRFGNYYNRELQQTQIDGYFNESLIKKNTDLSGKELEDFMLNYRPDYQKAKNWTEYDAVKYIRDTYKKYTDTLKKK